MFEKVVPLPEQMEITVLHRVLQVVCDLLVELPGTGLLDSTSRSFQNLEIGGITKEV